MPEAWGSSCPSGTHLQLVRCGYNRRLLTDAGEQLATARLSFTGVSYPRRVIVGDKRYESRSSLKYGTHRATTEEWVEVGYPATLVSLSGHHIDRRADARIRRGDGSWLWFPVEGPRANAVMTAVAENGEILVRFRYEPKMTNTAGSSGFKPFRFDPFWTRRTIEMVVSPNLPLTQETYLVVTVAAHLLIRFFGSSR
jgi:hypothetical protein